MNVVPAPDGYATTHSKIIIRHTKAVIDNDLVDLAQTKFLTFTTTPKQKSDSDVTCNCNYEKWMHYFRNSPRMIVFERERQYTPALKVFLTVSLYIGYLSTYY